jgi:hypothetical protein
MNLYKVLLLAYLLLPFAAALWPTSLGGRGAWASKGAVASGLRILILLFFGRLVVLGGGSIAVSGTLVNGYPLGFLLTLDSYRYGFLLTAEFCFLLSHWMSSTTGPHAQTIRVLIGFAQGFCSLFAASDNAVATGALQFLAGPVFFYLVRFSIRARDEEVAASISTRMYVLYFLLGLMMIAWGITEFADKDLLFGRGSGSALGLLIWMALVILAIPMPPWSRWFTQAVEHLPEGVTVTLVTFLSAVALKFASLFNVVYPDLNWKQKLVLYCLGIIGSAFSIGGLFAAQSRRRMLGSLPSFFFSLILVSLGVSKATLVLSAYFTCLFVPVFTALLLYASVIQVNSPLQKFFVGILFVLILGLPGTPVYQIFSGIGARSLDMGVNYTIVFGLIWFFYFSVNVHICRRIFMDPRPPEPGASVTHLESAPALFAGYGVFLMCMIIAIAQIAGRIL